ncbi:hypothetical protein Pcinc_016142 [Petrolisthes cinctipes]|uniref:Uncharacterized protein n=1 Tax=Petrolisthes cinctipes TaxID=88211 RepID=A0AAE1FRK9_PETCI|nr:hypothetical protein Pcinc_016142 [Petrolisthes cinctipes]
MWKTVFKVPEVKYKLNSAFRKRVKENHKGPPLPYHCTHQSSSSPTPVLFNVARDSTLLLCTSLPTYTHTDAQVARIFLKYIATAARR